MERLAIFDIDYTLTKRETLFELYIFMLKKNPRLIKHAPRNIVSTLLYILKLRDASKAKETFIRFIDGIKEDEMREIVKDFYEKKLSKIFYEDAINMMRKLKKRRMQNLCNFSLSRILPARIIQYKRSW